MVSARIVSAETCKLSRGRFGVGYEPCMISGPMMLHWLTPRKGAIGITLSQWISALPGSRAPGGVGEVF